MNYLICGKRFLILLGLLLTTYGICISQGRQYLFEEPTKLVGSVNSSYEESLPLKDPAGKYLYFVRSFHPANTGGKKSGHDIWRIGLPVADGKASNNFPLFNNDEANAVVGFSRDGKFIYVLEADKKWLTFKKSSFEQGQWTTPVATDFPRLRNYGDFNGLYIHPSEGIVLISMQATSGRKDEDIYALQKNFDGSWSEPIRLPDNINTTSFEVSPFLSQDGTTLFFSRETDPGNADILYATRSENSWQKWSDPKPLNINSPLFDAYFSIYPDGTAFFVSNRDAEMTDIYQTKLIQSTEESVVSDRQSAENPSEAIDQVVAGVAQESQSKENDNQESKSMSAVATAGNAMIFFEFSSAELMSPMQDLLDFLSSDLKKADGYLIELVGHADELGSSAFNQRLSEQRAKKVMDYLAQAGVDPEKMIYSGKGESNPLETNNSEYGRRKNRRVEIILTKTD